MATSTPARSEPAAGSRRGSSAARARPGVAASGDVADASRPRPRARTRLDMLLLIVLGALAMLLTARGIGEGGFRFSDASRHAMDGVFVHDFVADLPDSAGHPFEYGLKYYARYPCLGIGLYYPPFFATVEAGAFAVFGVSAFTARLTVVLFAMLAVLLMYALLRHFTDPLPAAVATATFIALPTVVYWGRVVMLEVPTAAMVLAAVLLFYRYVERAKPWDAIWSALLIVAAVMSKQTALFIVPACAAYIVVRRRWRILRQWQFWAGVALIAATLVPYFILTMRHSAYLASRSQIGGSLAGPSWLTVLWGKLTYVLKGWASCLTLPHEWTSDAFGRVLAPSSAIAPVLGWLVFWLPLILCGAAMVACAVWELVRPRARATWLMVLLVAFFLAESVYLRAGSTRYPILILPILVSFLPMLVWRMGWLTPRRLLIPAIVAVAALAALSFVQPIPYRRGHAEAARQLVARADHGQFVLFDGHWDGDIVFFVRQHDPQSRLYVLRGNKMLDAYASFPYRGYRALIHDEQELTRFLLAYGIHTVALEEKMLVETKPGRMLRRAVQDTDQYVRAGTIRIDAPGTRLDGTNLALYHVIYAGSPWAKELEIPLVGLNRTIRVPLDPRQSPVVVDLRKPPPEPVAEDKPTSRPRLTHQETPTPGGV